MENQQYPLQTIPKQEYQYIQQQNYQVPQGYQPQTNVPTQIQQPVQQYSPPQQQFTQQTQQVQQQTQPQVTDQTLEVMDKKSKKARRRKIKIEYIKDKSKRHITFSKRKGGIMKKVYELSTLTGTQALLLVASETGHVYTFATPKLQPLITKIEGKNLIQACLNAPDNAPEEEEEESQEPMVGELKQTQQMQIQQQQLQGIGQMHSPMHNMYQNQQQMNMNSYNPPPVMRINVSQNQSNQIPQIQQMNIHQYNPHQDM